MIAVQLWNFTLFLWGVGGVKDVKTFDLKVGSSLGLLWWCL
jgi:hypothetical protein